MPKFIHIFIAEVGSLLTISPLEDSQIVSAEQRMESYFETVGEYMWGAIDTINEESQEKTYEL